MISSPCVGMCRIDENLGLCVGCARSGAEIAAWGAAPAEDRRRIWAELPARRARLGLNLHRFDWDREDLRTFLVESLRKGGVWTAVNGDAAAELPFEPREAAAVEAESDAFRAATPRGVLSVHLADFARAFSVGALSGQERIVLATARGRALAQNAAEKAPARSVYTALGAIELFTAPPSRKTPPAATALPEAFVACFVFRPALPEEA